MASENGNGRVLWWIMSIVGAVITSATLFTGAQLLDLRGRISALEAKMDILIMDRKDRRR